MVEHYYVETLEQQMFVDQFRQLIKVYSDTILLPEVKLSTLDEALPDDHADEFYFRIEENRRLARVLLQYLSDHDILFTALFPILDDDLDLDMNLRNSFDPSVEDADNTHLTFSVNVPSEYWLLFKLLLDLDIKYNYRQIVKEKINNDNRMEVAGLNFEEWDIQNDVSFGYDILLSPFGLLWLIEALPSDRISNLAKTFGRVIRFYSDTIAILNIIAEIQNLSPDKLVAVYQFMDEDEPLLSSIDRIIQEQGDIPRFFLYTTQLCKYHDQLTAICELSGENSTCQQLMDYFANQCHVQLPVKPSDKLNFSAKQILL